MKKLLLIFGILSFSNIGGIEYDDQAPDIQESIQFIMNLQNDHGNKDTRFIQEILMIFGAFFIWEKYLSGHKIEIMRLWNYLKSLVPDKVEIAEKIKDSTGFIKDNLVKT